MFDLTAKDATNTFEEINKVKNKIYFYLFARFN